MYLTLSRLIVALEQCHVLVQRFRLEMSAWRLQCAKSGWNYSVQIATAQFITECDGEFYKIARAFLLRHDTIYYKMRRVLHGALKRKRPNGHNTSIPYFVIIS